MQGTSANVVPSAAGSAISGRVYCMVCKAYLFGSDWGRHPSTKQHQRKLRFSALVAALEEATKDKHGITISHHPAGLDFGTIALENALMVEGSFLVKNTVPLSDIVLKKAQLSSAASTRSSRYSVFCSCVVMALT